MPGLQNFCPKQPTYTWNGQRTKNLVLHCMREKANVCQEPKKRKNSQEAWGRWNLWPASKMWERKHMLLTVVSPSLTIRRDQWVTCNWEVMEEKKWLIWESLCSFYAVIVYSCSCLKAFVLALLKSWHHICSPASCPDPCKRPSRSK